MYIFQGVMVWIPYTHPTHPPARELNKRWWHEFWPLTSPILGEMPPCPTIFSLATTWIGIDEETHVTTVTSPHWYISWSREYGNQELWVIISLKLWTGTHWFPPLLGSHLCGTPKRPVQPYHFFDPPGALCSLREWTGTLMGTWGLTVIHTKVTCES